MHSRLLPCVHLTLEMGGLRAERTFISGGSFSRFSAARQGRGTGYQCLAPCTETLLSAVLFGSMPRSSLPLFGVYARGSYLRGLPWGSLGRPGLGGAKRGHRR